MDVFSTKSNSSSMQIDYFGQKKWKSQIKHCGQNVKLGLLKTFHFPHLKYQLPKGGEQNHPSVNMKWKCVRKK